MLLQNHSLSVSEALNEHPLHNLTLSLGFRAAKTAVKITYGSLCSYCYLY